jgi:hypothetical protein
MNVIKAVALGIWIICGWAISDQANSGMATQDTVAVDTSAATTTESMHSEASLPLAGRWVAAETAEEEKQRLKAIDEVTNDLGRFKRGKARSRLKERTSPIPSLKIEVSGSTVAIATGDHRLELELGGSPVEIEKNDMKTQMSAKMEGDRLVVLSRGDKGGRTVVYQADGDSLLVEVTMTNDNLSGPLKYVTTYARIK